MLYLRKIPFVWIAKEIKVTFTNSPKKYVLYSCLLSNFGLMFFLIKYFLRNLFLCLSVTAMDKFKVLLFNAAEN